MERRDYKKIRELLREFNKIEAKKKDLEYELSLLEEDIGINPINYERIGTSYNISNSTQKQALEIASKKEEIIKTIKVRDIELKKIENILNILNPIEKQILDARYFQNHSWTHTAYLVDRSMSHCKALENKAIGQIAAFLN